MFEGIRRLGKGVRGTELGRIIDDHLYAGV